MREIYVTEDQKLWSQAFKTKTLESSGIRLLEKLWAGGGRQGWQHQGWRRWHPEQVGGAVDVNSQFCELGKEEEEGSWGTQTRVEGDSYMFGFGEGGNPFC